MVLALWWIFVCVKGLSRTKRRLKFHRSGTNFTIERIHLWILKKDKQKGVYRFIGGIEKAVNKLPSPFMMFIGLFFIVAILSFFMRNVAVINPSTNELVQINNFFSKEGLTWILTTMTSNFSGFASLGLVLTMTLGISLCEQVGLVDSLLKKSMRGVPASVMPYLIALIGTCGNLASDTCSVLVPPLAAIAFLGVGRSPDSRYALRLDFRQCRLFRKPYDRRYRLLLAGITNTSIQVLLGADTTFTVDSACNWYFFMAASTILVALVIGWCTTTLWNHTWENTPEMLLFLRNLLRKFKARLLKTQVLRHLFIWQSYFWYIHKGSLNPDGSIVVFTVFKRSYSYYSYALLSCAVLHTVLPQDISRASVMFQKPLQGYVKYGCICCILFCRRSVYGVVLMDKKSAR